MSRLQSFNPFDLLSDGDDTPKQVKQQDKKPAAPVQAASKAAPEPTQSKPAQSAKQAAKPAAGTAKPAQAASSKSAPTNKSQETKAPAQAGGKAPAKRADSNVVAAAAPTGSSIPDEAIPDKERGVRSNRGSTERRVATQGRDARPSRGREFERRSGTGRSQTENKKGGSGKGNWGNEAQDAIADKEAPEAVASTEEQTEDVQPTTETAEGSATAAAATAETTGEESEKKEEEKPVFGIEEYYKRLKKKAPKVGNEQLKLREINSNETANDLTTAGFKLLQKDTDDSALLPKKKEVAPKKTEAKKEAKPAAATDASKKINVNDLLSFKGHQESRPRREYGDRNYGDRNNNGERNYGDRNNNNGERRDRGDRPYRGGKQGGPRGPPRNNNSNSPAAAAPSFGDTDFPTLGGKSVKA